MKNSLKCGCKFEGLQAEKKDLGEQANLNQNDHHELADLHIDKNILGESIVEVNRDARHHHQIHGNRKYKAFKNHSSADDQPQVFTDLHVGRR